MKVIIMIYRRDNPKTPCMRFRSVILNPVGTKLKYKFCYKIHQDCVGRHFGSKTCLHRKKSRYATKFNLNYGVQHNGCSIICSISLARRYKTFVGLVRHSTGALNCIPLFNGANIGQYIKVCSYITTPKINYFARFYTGTTVPVAYLPIMTCCFNIQLAAYTTKQTWFCLAAGTFCTIVRLNSERGFSIVKIPSGKTYVLGETAYVMLGRNSNTLPKGIWKGKAGVSTKRGFCPVVRGVAKNPVDHPHGGRTKTNAPERTPWGRVAKFNK